MSEDVKTAPAGLKNPRKNVPVREAAPVGELVKARVTKWGDGQLSTGVHVPGEGDIMHEAGEIVELPRENALALEDRRFVEIIED